jgi:hypothetical protein
MDAHGSFTYMSRAMRLLLLLSAFLTALTGLGSGAALVAEPVAASASAAADDRTTAEAAAAVRPAGVQDHSADGVRWSRALPVVASGASPFGERRRE